ncbi:hypothetical protein ACNFU2_06870 [Chryseobacterium sp. PTM-20240506]|uniref:hypothetical protein n=1 Tax=Chryseobacterium sp. PTM-20240506 TaxID=3400631 RepID=UPI003AACCE8D
MAKILGTTISYLLRETEEINIFKDPAMLNRFSDIKKLDPENKKHLHSIVDGLFKHSKLKI